MTYTGLFEEGKVIEKLKIKNNYLKIKIKNLEGLEEIHRKNNGDLRVHIVKLEKQIVEYKKDIDRLSEERDNFETLAKSNAASR